MELPRGGQKTGQNKGFFVVVSCLFFLFHLLMVILAFLLLLLCFRSLRWLCFLVSIHLYVCCALYFSFSCLSLLSSLLVQEKPDQMRNYLTILFSCLCFGACIPTLSLGPTNNPARPREEPLKMVYFCLVSCSVNTVLKYLFLQCFLHINQKLPTKWAPIKTIMFHKVHNKNRCLEMVFLDRWKHSCSPKHRT